MQAAGNGGDTFLRNVGLFPNCAALQPRRPCLSWWPLRGPQIQQDVTACLLLADELTAGHDVRAFAFRFGSVSLI
jgi:hypothetical protein